jgi:hypothetical protein
MMRHRSRPVLRVQLFRERLGRQADCIVAEYSKDHFCFGRNDLAIACDRHAIVRCPRHLVAVAETASGLPELHAAAQSSPRLVGEILQEEGVHRALQPNVQVRDVSSGEGDDIHAGEGEALEESGGVLLIPAEPVQRLREYDVKSPVQRVPHQRLEAGAKQGGAGDRVIGEFVNNHPTVASCEVATHPELVRNRCVALVVR